MRGIAVKTAYVAGAVVLSGLVGKGIVAVQQTPTFRGRVEVVQLSVSVFDRQHQAIRGLTAQDFTVLEGGKAQPVVGLSAIGLDRSVASQASWMQQVAPDVTTNELKSGRLFVLLLDDALIPSDPKIIANAKVIAKGVISKLEPDDLAAVVFTSDNRHTQDFTDDHSKLLAACDTLAPGLASYLFGYDLLERPSDPTATPRRAPTVDPDTSFYQSSVRTLDRVTKSLASITGRRKVVIFVSPGIPLDLEEAVPTHISQARQGMIVGGGDIMAVMQDLSRRTSEAFLQAQRANVVVYPIDPTGLGSMRGYLATRPSLPPVIAAAKAASQFDYLMSAAANTGGHAIVNVDEFEAGITDLFKENEFYYLLSFEPLAPAVDGALRHIEVKVNRPGVDVRAPTGYYAQGPDKAPTRISSANKASRPTEVEELAKAIGDFLPNGSLPGRVALAPLAVPGEQLTTVAIVYGVRQPVAPASTKTRTTQITELQISAFSPEGDPKGTQRQTARIVLRPGADGEAVYEVLSRLDLPPGRYSLKVAAYDTSSGKSGSVFADVSVPDYRHLLFSGSPVMLSAEPSRVAAPKDVLAPLLPFIPTAERDFDATDKVTAFIRLYQNGQEPIEPVRMAVGIRDQNGDLKFTDTQTIGREQFAATGIASGALSSADFKVSLPLTQLPQGPYVLTLEAARGQATLRRDIRFGVN